MNQEQPEMCNTHTLSVQYAPIATMPEKEALLGLTLFKLRSMQLCAPINVRDGLLACAIRYAVRAGIIHPEWRSNRYLEVRDLKLGELASMSHAALTAAPKIQRQHVRAVQLFLERFGLTLSP